MVIFKLVLSQAGLNLATLLTPMSFPTQQRLITHFFGAVVPMVHQYLLANRWPQLQVSITLSVLICLVTTLAQPILLWFILMRGLMEYWSILYRMWPSKLGRISNLQI